MCCLMKPAWVCTGEVERSKRPFKKASRASAGQNFSTEERQEAFFDRHIAPEFNPLNAIDSWAKRLDYFTDWQERREADPLAGKLQWDCFQSFWEMRALAQTHGWWCMHGGMHAWMDT
jgi:hypothetical protein